jgi:cell division protein FtsQ
MARKSTAQLDLELPDEEPGPEIDAPAPRRPRAAAKAEPRPAWRRLRFALRCASGALALAAAVVVPYKLDQFLASDSHFLLPEAGNFSVEGLLYTPQADVTRVFAGDFGRSVYLAPLAARRQALLKIDWVKDATVSRLWPNRLRVRIVERRPVAFLMLPAGGLLEPAMVDADGIILRPPPRASLSLPALHGITREQPAAARRARMRQVTDLLAALESYAPQISEIDVTDSNDLVVTQLVEGRAIRLRLGNRNYLPRLRSFLKSYGDISRRLPASRTFDLRLDNYFMAEDGGTRPAAGGGPR